MYGSALESNSDIWYMNSCVNLFISLRHSVTIIYNLGGLVTLGTPKVSQHRSQTMHANTCKGNKHSAKSRFCILVHGIKHLHQRTYLGCKVVGCKSRFPSVKKWNSHHRLEHHNIPLVCNTCGKKFKTPSFLQDHGYVHMKVAHKCEKCDKTFPFKCLYRIHVHTHL